MSKPELVDELQESYALRAYWHARHTLQARHIKAESLIAQDQQYAYLYARDVIQDRWPEAEPIIAKDPYFSYYYTRDILKARWPEVEPAILQEREHCLSEYIKLILELTIADYHICHK